VTDTCTYITPVLRDIAAPVMTDSGKWAWYAPSNLGVEVALGSLEDCVRSAAAGIVIRDGALWEGR
jgi:predicted aconitase